MMIVVRKEIISRDSFPMLGKWIVVGEKQCTVGKVEQGRQPLSDISPTNCYSYTISNAVIHT